MEFESYTCEKTASCKRKKQFITCFLRCNFPRNCWNSIGVVRPRRVRQLHVQGAMEIMIHMS
jgi:hypothetical protein